MRHLCFILFFVCSLAKAEWSDWDDKDKALLVTSTGLLIVDWVQTREMMEGRHGTYRLSETNPILGPHPSLSKVNWYFGSWVIGNYLIADYFGKDRWIYLGAVTAIEISATRNNYRLGIRVGF